MRSTVLQILLLGFMATIITIAWTLRDTDRDW